MATIVRASVGRIRVNDAGVAYLNTRAGILGRWGERFVNQAAQVSLVALNARTKNTWGRTGKLERSIDGEWLGSSKRGVSLRVKADAPYALYVHEGTRTPITAGGRMMPVGKSQGRVLFYAREVRGQRANPFLREGVNTVLVRNQLRPIRG